MLRSFPVVVVLSFALLLGGCAASSATTTPAPQTSPSSSSSSKKDVGPKKFSDVIKDDFVKDEGIFNVYQDDQTYYYEIPDAMLGQEFLLVTRIAKTADNIGYGGQKVNTQVVRWDRTGDKIFLRVVGYENRGAEDSPIFESVRNSNLEPIVRAFDVAALNADTTGIVIDATSLYTSDIPSLGLPSFRRSSYSVRRLDSNRSYISSVKSFPENVEVRHVLTYEATNAPSNSSTNTITVEMAQSMVKLPDNPMQPRLCDERVGLFSVRFTEYNGEQHRAEQKCYVTRWRLEPSDPEAYARGELVEPVEPIIYYVDQNTPEKWRQPLIDGVNDWQKSFEAAGFKNAIIGKMAPRAEEDPDFSPEDARYSVIRYFASDIQNASGPHVHDPRTGEILESDINWYHNVMQLLRNWYLIQTAAVNPAAQTKDFEDDVMAELVRFVSAHEVGHTIGFQHNMGSSHAYTVDQLRDPEFTSTHGTAPSIMDYARFNYVAQPEDGVTQFGPMVGEYDDWATKWTYSWIAGDRTPDEEFLILNEWVKERADDPAMLFLSGFGDPRQQTENISNDEMEASRLGVLNLQRILDNLVEWTAEEGKDWAQLQELYGQVGSQFNRYMGHVSSNIGGVYEQPKTSDQDGVVYSPVPEERQRRAVQWMADHVFTTPEWMIRDDIMDRIENGGITGRIRGYQVSGISRLLDPQKLARLLDGETRWDGDQYTVSELMADMRSAIFSKLSSGASVDSYRRNVQRGYVDRLEFLMTLDFNASSTLARFGFQSIDADESDLRMLVKAELETLKPQVDRGADRTRDAMTRLHLRDLSDRIEHILDPED
ncbi:MAG: zinc-dependent metalloprotease [Rhodothermales bacterium]